MVSRPRLWHNGMAYISQMMFLFLPHFPDCKKERENPQSHFSHFPLKQMDKFIKQVAGGRRTELPQTEHEVHSPPLPCFKSFCMNPFARSSSQPCRWGRLHWAALLHPMNIQWSAQREKPSPIDGPMGMYLHCQGLSSPKPLGMQQQPVGTPGEIQPCPGQPGLVSTYTVNPEGSPT